MAISHGTVVGVYGIPGHAGDEDSSSKHCAILLSIPATEVYAQADGIEILTVNTEIENWLRNGKTVTVLGGIGGRCARSTANAEMNVAGVAAGTGLSMSAATTLHGHVYLADNATEHANAAMTAQLVPFEIIVRYTEA